MKHLTVLGAGLSGLAAAQRGRENGHSVDLYEAHPYVGGHTASHTYPGGWIFDEGPHVSFTKNETVKEMFAKATGGEFNEFSAGITNFWRDYWVTHPAQVNLHALPRDVVERCLLDFIEIQYNPPGPPQNYAEWCLNGLGKTFSEEFTYAYTRKYWTVEAADMTTDWVGARMHAPSLQQVVHGALGPQEENLHYLTQFRYPKHGGFSTYVNAVKSDAELHLGHRLGLVDLKRRELEFENGQKAGFESLISSVPLPEFVKRIKDVPAAVQEAADWLTCTSVALVNIGMNRSEVLTDTHWMYVYDEDILTSRIHFPHKLSLGNAPAGAGSIQAEVYYSRYKPLPTEDVLGKTIDDLTRMGLLEKGEDLPVADTHKIAYANVLFDHKRTENLAVVQNYLKENDIACCGRFGEWAYYWTDDSIVSGWRAADALSSPGAAG